MSSASPDGTRSFLTWVWAALLILGGLIFLGFNTGIIRYEGPIQPLVAAGIAVVALPFLGWRIAHPQAWWALLTAWVFLAMAILLGVIGLQLPPQVIAVIAAVEIAVPFAAVFVGDRQKWWALIPAYVLLVVAGLIALTMLPISSLMLAAFALLAAALPFWLAFIVNRRNWWALIPAGVLTLFGVGMLVLLSLFQISNNAFFVILNATLALVFAVLWIAVRRLDWALWIALGFAGAAVLSIWFPSGTNWALIALMLGLYIVYRQVRRPAPAQVATPTAAGQPPAQPTPMTQAPSTQATQPTSAAPVVIPPPDDAGVSESPPPAVRPVVEFRPLDPFKDRRSDDDKPV
jgi:hypothetical protein